MLSQYLNPLFEIESFDRLNQVILHMDYVNLLYEYDEVSVSEMEAYRYQGNLYGLFREMRVSRNMMLYTMHLNGFTNPLNYDGKQTIFKIPVEPAIPN